MRGIRAVVGALGLLSLLGYTLGFPRIGGLGEQTHVVYVGLFTCLFVLYLTAAWAVLRRRSEDRILLGMILAFGLLFRLLVLPSPIVLSSDIYRYLWDGRVHWAGINPYRYPPAAPELVPLRDRAIHPQINRPDKRTVYPPGAEAAFALVATVAPGSILGWRLFILACEVATGVLLLRLLRRMAVPATTVVLYAWAPLVVFEGVQAGHVDFVLLPAILLALWWRQEGRMVPAGVALGIAILIKLYPAVLLVAWWRRGDWRFAGACAAVVAAGYCPYLLGVGTGVVGFLPQYLGSGEDFNVGLRFFLTQAIGLTGEAARGVAMGLLFMALLLVLLKIGKDQHESAIGVFRAGMGAAAAYLVLTPTAMHAWYAVWILLFLTIRPSAAWLWFTGAVALSYLKYASEPMVVPLWARLLEFLPLYVLLAWEWLTGQSFWVSTSYHREWRLAYARSCASRTPKSP